jgi:hypothetical protein
VGRKHVLSKRIQDIDQRPADDDISLFVQNQLGDVTALERKWPNNVWRRLLVEKSEGLFQWAYTACLFVKGDEKRGLDPVEQLDILLSSASQSAHLSRLDRLYLEILTQIFGEGDDGRIVRRFRSIMGLILVAKEPLPIPALQKLCDQEESEDAVNLIVGPQWAHY